MKAQTALNPISSLEAREELITALKLDLVGPWANHSLAEEKLPGWVRPSNWYVTGFLIPNGTPPEKSSDPDQDEEIDAIPESAGLTEESVEERKAAKKSCFPSSMGLSFLVQQETHLLDVTVRWGDYETSEVQGEEGTIPVWQRTPHEEKIRITLNGGTDTIVRSVPGSNGLQIHVADRVISAEELKSCIPSGTRSVSVFLVNSRKPNDEVADLAYVFQAELEVHSEIPFVARPNPRGAGTEDWDELVSDLHYANTPEYATGHGVSAEWEMANGSCTVLRTAWIPSARVEKTETSKITEVELSLDALGSLEDGPAVTEALQPLVNHYRTWIEEQREGLKHLTGKRLETAEELLHLAGIAADRIEQGIRILAEDDDARDAFRVANRAVAAALRKRLQVEKPSWRAFQLAFILLNLPGLADRSDPNRETVDLLFFPTGGGKTEAYLGLAAFAMVLRRLRNPGEEGMAGAGVTVVMRYTLRLLTLDQLGRASGLVCALELEREKNPDRYGKWPFEIGLWVGKAATPNILGRKGDNRSDTARIKVRDFKADPRGKPSPIPLENCPWCGSRFEPNSFSLLPNDDNPNELRIVCTNFECEFARDRALPIVAVDDMLYRRLPAFLISTVDKFASLPWVGQSGVLMGGADRRDPSGFYGAAEPGKGMRMAAPLLPPDLIIQDELHLISGPLGTMTGLYEAAIEALCIREADGRRMIRPKIVASTATVRRANDQIQALFARSLTQVFPPPGPDRRNSFFATTVPPSVAPARLYLGVSSKGRNPKELLRRIWLVLMGSAERIYREAGGAKNKKNPADPYMTVLGYFNSLRELGGARRILEEQVQNTIKGYGSRKRIGEEKGLFRDRKSFKEVVELTSRVPTNKVAEARQRLGLPFYENSRVDCAIATNMISVGLDVPRLGLMVVVGQPKTHSEYIQATSRVGRTDEAPGLVVTMLNVDKPRDRSHYERFRHYHETFYRSVEVGSVTPFSSRALDRGFAGALVGLARHVRSELTPARGVENIAQVRADIEKLLLDVFRQRIEHQPFHDTDEKEEKLHTIQNRIVDLLDSWRKIFDDYHNNGVEMQYQKYEEKQPRPLLREMLDTEFDSEHHRKFKASRSLRDVEPEVNLFLHELTGTLVEDNA